MAENLRWDYGMATELANKCSATEAALHELASALASTVASFEAATEGNTRARVVEGYEKLKPFLDQQMPQYLADLRDYINKKSEGFGIADNG